MRSGQGRSSNGCMHGMAGFKNAWLRVTSILFIIFIGGTYSRHKFGEPQGPIEGRLFKGNRNAIFLIQQGRKSLIPDFYTFSKMGFNLSSIEKVPDDYLSNIPTGEAVKPIPVFRPEDYMYHKNCEDPDRMVEICSDYHII